MRHVSRALVMLALVTPVMAQAQRSPLIIDRDRVDRTPVKPPTEAPARTVPGEGRAQTDTPGAPDIALASVEINGTTIGRGAFESAWKPLVGKPLNLETINAVAAGIGALYAKSNAALYNVLVPNQDFAGGVLKVRVIEGHISGVVIDDDKGRIRSSLVKRYAARLLEEKPLRRETLERYLSLIRDIPGLTADAMFLPASEPDAVRLGLKLKEKRTNLVFSADNRGTALLGDFQFQAQGTANSLYSQGDQTVLTAATSGDFKRYRYIAGSHSLALDSEGTRFSVNAGYLKTRPKRSVLTGDAKLAGAQISRPLIRGYKKNLYATAAFDLIDSDNAAFGNLISSEHSRAARGALAYSNIGTKDVTTASLTVSRGLDVFKANSPGGAVDLTFTKANARATYDRSIGKAFAVRLKAAGQYSKDRLPSVETFTLGGDEFGRAFEYSTLLGDKGIAASAEFGWTPQSITGWAKGTNLYTFVDGGKVRLNPRGAFNGASFDLASAGAGVRLALGTKGYIGVEQAKSIDSPAPGFGGWKTIVSWRLSLR